MPKVMTSPSSPNDPHLALLRPIVRVKPAELTALLASTLWIFLTLTAYYIIKPLRGTILQQRIGVDNKWIGLLATTVFIAIVAYGYGKIVPRVTRSKLINVTFLLFVACLGAFAVALPRGDALTPYLFFVWVSTFNLMVVSQFWSLAADVWSKEEGARLFPFIGVGAVLGGIFGTVVVANLAKRLEPEQMLLLSGGVLLLCLLLARFILDFAAARRKAEAPQAASVPPGESESPRGAVALVLGSPYLRLIALMMLVLNVVNSNNEWIMDKMLSREHLSKAELTEFYATYFLVQNVITFAIQLFLTARIQARFGTRVALFFEPGIGLLGGLIFMMVPILPVMVALKVLENASDYSIQSNTKELLYLPTSRIEKYSAKNLNDTFVVRGGDALAAASIFTATHFVLPAFGDVGLKLMVAFDVVLGVLWLIIANRVGRMHKQLMDKSPLQPTTATAHPRSLQPRQPEDPNAPRPDRA